MATELSDLTAEQQEVVNTWNQGVAVMAGAGSGKTTTLVMKCQELLKRNPEARFAAVSFTERSASDLRDKLSTRLSLTGKGGALSGHWVMTIHGLCGAIIREYPREAGFDGEEAMLSEPEAIVLWERAVESLWLDALPDEAEQALELLLLRESRTDLATLLKRVRELEGFGVIGHLVESPDESTCALGVLSRLALERYDRLKRRRGALDFADLEAGARRALQFLPVRRHYQRRFDLLLIDEFQDTNQIQADILWSLAKEDRSNLCVVGDPKQSIYRFRDADVTIFEDLCGKLPKRLSLTWNFRSRPELLEFINRVCAPTFSTGSSVDYEPLIAKREPSPLGLGAVVRVPVEAPNDLARWLKSEMAAGAQLQDMALLLRTIRGNEVWLSALTAAGIPIAVGSGGLFWEDPRVRELVALLKWWDNPRNEFSGAVFLRAPWIGIEDRTLDDWLREDRTWQKPFFASGHPVARALGELRTRPVRPGEVLQKILEAEGGEALEAELGSPLLGLWHRAEELSTRGMGFHEVVTELTRASEESRRERDVPPPRNTGQLSVLTIHGSKGLEFPHVILLDFPPKARKAGNAPMLFWDRARGVFLAKRDETGARLLKKDPDEVPWRDSERDKDIAEQKRVFYVALTRARERLTLIWPPEAPEKAPPKKEKAPDPPEALYDKDFWRGWIERNGLPPEAVPAVPLLGALLAREPAAPVKTPVSAREIRYRRPRHSVTEWMTLHRCPRHYSWKFLRAPVGLPQATRPAVAEGDDGRVGLSQRELGTRVHAALETADWESLKRLEAEAGSDRVNAEKIITWAESSPMMRAKGRSEVGFEVPIGGEVLVGSIDRLVKETLPDGRVRYEVVDFKVTERVKAHDGLFEAYEVQLQLYAWAVWKLEREPVNAWFQARLVNISGADIQELEVPIDLTRGQRLATDAARISGDAVTATLEKPLQLDARPGSLCRYCDFRAFCPEGAQTV